MRVAGPALESRECRAACAGLRVALGERDASVSEDRDRGQAPPPGVSAPCAEMGKLRQAGSEGLQRTPLPATTERTKRDGHPGLLTSSSRLAHFCLPTLQTGHCAGREPGLHWEGRRDHFCPGACSGPGKMMFTYGSFLSWSAFSLLVGKGWMGRRRQGRVFSRVGWTGGFRVFRAIRTTLRLSSS